MKADPSRNCLRYSLGNCHGNSLGHCQYPLPLRYTGSEMATTRTFTPELLPESGLPRELAERGLYKPAGIGCNQCSFTTKKKGFFGRQALRAHGKKHKNDARAWQRPLMRQGVIAGSIVAMVQCFLPQQSYSDPVWQTDHGKASLMIEAGRIPDPTTPNRFVQRAVPHGTKARLIMPYIIGYAVQHRTPEIDMGDSLRRFLEQIGMSAGGSQGKQVTHQVENIAASTITLGYWDDAEVHADRLPIARRVSFWLERNEQQQALWNPSLVLGSDFFQALRYHRVPIDMDHLVQLATSPRRQDLYSWLNYRLPKLRKPLHMPYDTMQAVFGQGITDPYKYRQTLKRDLNESDPISLDTELA